MKKSSAARGEKKIPRNYGRRLTHFLLFFFPATLILFFAPPRIHPAGKMWAFFFLGLRGVDCSNYI